MSTKKPTPAQLNILQQMNEDICILREDTAIITLWIRVYDYSKRKPLQNITKKTLELLIFNDWVKIDHSKSSNTHFYYFITDKGKAAINES
jgi:hypothetical protein